MLNGYKIVVVTPAGRKRYMEILLPYILRERRVVDEYRIWINTRNQDDINYFREIKQKYPNFISLDETNLNWENYQKTEQNNMTIHRFFKNCTDNKTIYLRLDDDIIYLSDNYIEKMARFRIENKEPFLIYGTILNNSVVDSILQKMGYYPNNNKIEYDCLDENGWNNAQEAEKKHRFILDNYLLKNKKIPEVFSKWVLADYERVSINSICWLGETFSKFEGVVDADEELWLSVTKPKEIEKPNVINGNSICIHYAFFTQRDYIENSTNILAEYKNICEKEFQLKRRKKI